MALKAHFYDKYGKRYGGGEFESLDVAKEQAERARAHGMMALGEGAEDPPLLSSHACFAWVPSSEAGRGFWQEVTPRDLYRHFAIERMSAEDNKERKNHTPDYTVIVTKSFVRAQAREVVVQDELTLRAYQRLHEEGRISSYRLKERIKQCAISKATINTLMVKIKVDAIEDAEVDEEADGLPEDQEAYYEVCARRHRG